MPSMKGQEQERAAGEAPGDGLAVVVEPAVEAAPASKHAEVPSLPSLTLKQAAFVDAYLLSGSAAAAYRLAYDVDEMLPKTVRDAASILLRHSGISAAVATRRAEADEAVQAALVAARIGAPETVERMGRIAALDPEEHVQQLAPILRANEAIAGIAGIMPKGGGVTVNVDNRRIDTMAMELWQARKARERDEADV